ncbi:HD-GYP domain-containing protein [Gorillibacterium massiliense]|uniref:HD-GYP domain-containing protein n=1 Tax=Gorillibacterium massiliense TaxID=1280390 RepID=UPI0004B2C404|nr:HD domain-containing phosphohydrolase [Gorillibacterium massiliense]
MATKRNAEPYSTVAAHFCKENGQTYFLLKRLKAHDKFIYEQSLRSAYYSLLLARGLGLSGKEQEVVYRSALLADIGKLQTSLGADDAQEPRLSILHHPVYSAELLRPMSEQGLVDGDGILHHHENLDGTGYPFGAIWEDISLTARILRVADSFAAMTSVDRKTGSVAGVEEALNELYRWSDVLYDSDLVMLLCYCFDNLLPNKMKDKGGTDAAGETGVVRKITP